MVFLDLRFLQQQLEGGGCLALFTLSLCLPFEVALFLYYHTVFYLFDIEKEIINASKKRKTYRKSYHPHRNLMSERSQDYAQKP
jgi:hypothetical protein